MTTVGIIISDNDDVYNNLRNNMIIYSADPCLRLLFFISSDNPEVQVAMGHHAIE